MVFPKKLRSFSSSLSLHTDLLSLFYLFFSSSFYWNYIGIPKFHHPERERERELKRNSGHWAESLSKVRLFYYHQNEIKIKKLSPVGVHLSLVRVFSLCVMRALPPLCSKAQGFHLSLIKLIHLTSPTKNSHHTSVPMSAMEQAIVDSLKKKRKKE